MKPENQAIAEKEVQAWTDNLRRRGWTEEDIQWFMDGVNQLLFESVKDKPVN